jgi:hypothetical protein
VDQFVTGFLVKKVVHMEPTRLVAVSTLNARATCLSPSHSLLPARSSRS